MGWSVFCQCGHRCWWCCQCTFVGSCHWLQKQGISFCSSIIIHTHIYTHTHTTWMLSGFSIALSQKDTKRFQLKGEMPSPSLRLPFLLPLVSETSNRNWGQQNPRSQGHCLARVKTRSKSNGTLHHVFCMTDTAIDLQRFIFSLESLPTENKYKHMWNQ